MILFIVQSVLPALLGYTLYVGTVGRLSPLRPGDPRERPRWLLGLGTAASVGGVVGATLHLAYAPGLQAGAELLQPASLCLALALSATLAATGVYRFRLADADAPPVHRAVAPSPAQAVDEIGAPLGMLPESRWAGTAERCERAAERLDGATPSVAAAAPSASVGESVVATARAQETALQCALDRERAVRERTEKHLRITRKALFVLDNEARGLEHHATDHLHLEALIEHGAREQALVEARAEREACAHLSSRTTIAEQREELRRARHALRSNAEARTRALSTATRSLAHAKRSARARRRLERDLDQARATLVQRQETVGSLIRALSEEKGRHREEIATHARRLQERERDRRRELEGTERAGRSRFGSRLVKKIAKPRPLIGG